METNEISRESFFLEMCRVTENSYLKGEEPWQESGMSGPYERWKNLRIPVAQAVEKGGSFLDIGCANGYLLECLMNWLKERKISIMPYGLDLSASLVHKAIERLPAYWDQFFVGNALTWMPPHCFDWVRTELVYVPSVWERNYLLHLLSNMLKPTRGNLLVCNYTEDHPNPGSKVIPGASATNDLKNRLYQLGFQVQDQFEGFDPQKGAKSLVCTLTIPATGISPIPASWTHPLRHRILRPHQDLKAMNYEGDSSPLSLHLGYFLEGSLKGVISLLDEGETGVLRLRGMAVDKEEQHRGLGSRLMERVRDFLNRNQFKKIWCNARTPAVPFYQKHGLEICSEEFEIEGIGPHFKMRFPA